MRRVVAGIQARMGSQRLPGKSLAPLGGKPLIEWVIRRARRAARVHEVWLLTTQNPEDDALAAAVRPLLPVIRGSATDVRSRYATLLEETGASDLVRITGDCALFDGALLDQLLELHQRSAADYSHIRAQPEYAVAYPNGMNAEVITSEAFVRMVELGPGEDCREHVTLSVYRFPGRFRWGLLEPPPELSRPAWKLSVDTPEELERVRAIVAALGPAAEDASVRDIVAVLDAHPEWLVPHSQ